MSKSDEPAMHKPAMHIKVEPQDDEDLVIPDANVQDNRWTYSSEGLDSRRAKAADGKPFNSQCFQFPYLDRPHFHHLRCGHDIATPTIQTCGSNCNPPTRFTGSDLKPNDTNFECPHPDCTRLSAVTPRINPKTRRRVYGRPCQLAHVRGRDAQADRDWEVEKQHLTELRGRMQRMNPKDKSLLRKTSRSPKTRRPAMPPLSRRASRASVRMTAEQLSREMDEATCKLFFAQKGKRTRALRESEEDISLDVPEREMTATGISKKPPASNNGRAKASKKPPVLSFAEHADGCFGHCSHCDVLLTGEFFCCEDCTEDDQDYSLCSECNETAYAKHLRFNPSHRLALRQNSPCDQSSRQDNEARVEASPVDIHCVCQSPDTRFMVDCQVCARPFHPGCIGMGSQDKAQYELPDREIFFKVDFRMLREHGIDTFLCHSCEALQRLNAGISAQRRSARKHADLLLEFKPKLMAHKQMAMNRAKTSEQEVVVQERFTTIEAQMDTASNFELWHWKSLLAQALKVPLPQPSARKRDARDMAMGSDGDETMADAAVSEAQGAPAGTRDWTKRTKVGMNEIDIPSQAYRYGGQMSLVLGNGKQGR